MGETEEVDAGAKAGVSEAHLMASRPRAVVGSIRHTGFDGGRAMR